MVVSASTIKDLAGCKVLLVGDFMLDTYTIGKASRISPEAPVPVVAVQREEHRAGGAGNVVLNLTSMGAEVVILGRVGDDKAGRVLIDTLRQEEVDISGLFMQSGYDTTIKNRIIAQNQQIVRIDFEKQAPVSEEIENRVIDLIPKLFHDVDAVAISDYGKGFLSRRVLRAVIEEAKKLRIPTITDPKGTDFSKYSGTTIIKPNQSEAYAAANLLPDSDLSLAASRIFESLEAQILMVTRSEAGISVFQNGGQRTDFPVHVREIKDVTGAGDTVLAMLTCAIANELSLADAVQLSNIAAGIAIERFGCARVSLTDVSSRLRLHERKERKMALV